MSVHRFGTASDPPGTIVIDDPATLKVFYDPVRQAIVRTLHEPLSVKELADRLDETPNRLYYHVRLLEARGLIAVAGERQAGSNTERLYTRAATRYEIAPGLAPEGEELFKPIQEAQDRQRFRRFADLLARADEKRVERLQAPMIQELHLRLEVDRANELRGRLLALLDEYIDPEGAGETGVRVDLLLLFLAAGEDGG